MVRVGLVSLDSDGRWIGGRYYLHHLVRCVAALPEAERVAFAGVFWGQAPPENPFAEVRDQIDGTSVLALPRSLPHRLRRALRRALRGQDGARDLFEDAGIDVLFPIAPCSEPGVPLVFWLSDFQYLHLPELFTNETREWYERHYRENVEGARLVALSSEHALRDFRRVFGPYEAKARLLRFCSVPDPSWWERAPAAVAEEKKLPGRFFVLANQFSHHKNHPVVFQAVKRLRERGIDVTVACTGSTWGFRGNDYLESIVRFLDENDLRGQIHILGMLPRAEQIALVRRSIAMLQPSRFEGWSTVVEDAKTLGKPILLSGIDVHREQMGPAYGHYLPLDDAEAWADALAALWTEAAPGPDVDQERLGLSRLATAQQECGRTFAAMAREAAGR